MKAYLATPWAERVDLNDLARFGDEFEDLTAQWRYEEAIGEAADAEMLGGVTTILARAGTAQALFDANAEIYTTIHALGSAIEHIFVERWPDIYKRGEPLGGDNFRDAYYWLDDDAVIGEELRRRGVTPPEHPQPWPIPLIVALKKLMPGTMIFDAIFAPTALQHGYALAFSTTESGTRVAPPHEWRDRPFPDRHALGWRFALTRDLRASLRGAGLGGPRERRTISAENLVAQRLTALIKQTRGLNPFKHREGFVKACVERFGLSHRAALRVFDAVKRDGWARGGRRPKTLEHALAEIERVIETAALNIERDLCEVRRDQKQ